MPLWTHPEWRERFPRLIQGTTGRGDPDAPFDLGVYGSTPVGESMRRWRLLMRATGMPTAVHSRQVHGAEIAEWLDPFRPSIVHVEGHDAHLTDQAGILLTVSIADCVPVFVVSGDQRVVAMVHAGWRSVAASIIERAVARLQYVGGVEVGDLWMHCGPSICGACYEVGPEVHRAVNPDAPAPSAPTPIDLRASIAARAERLGIEPDRITRSSHCTLCNGSEFFSHRGGAPQRQLGVLGLLR